MWRARSNRHAHGCLTLLETDYLYVMADRISLRAGQAKNLCDNPEQVEAALT
ncbi:MAG: hypothetical protein K0S45_2736 [Nitrospira sp.]|jgi:hypothetical protein|nr:hypothetical protein [Nitrospira sp.]